MQELIKHLNKPQIVALIGDTNQGKSMLIYDLVNSLRQKCKFNLVTYGLRVAIPNSTTIFSVEEMEVVTNSVLVLDEFSSLIDIDNRKVKNQIENTLRLLHHNNNIVILGGLSCNFKKFISAKCDMFIYKTLKLSELINGSRAKELIKQYQGYEKGASMLNLPINQALLFNGHHYSKLQIRYLKEYDTKIKNEAIFKPKK